MLDFMRRFVQPGNVAALATLLVALGVETDSVFLHHAFEVAGAVIAVIAFFLGGSSRKADAPAALWTPMPTQGEPQEKPK